MFQIFTGLATLLGKDREYLGLLDTCLRAADTEYEREFFLTEKITFLRHGGKTEAAEQLIAENLDIPELRLVQVDAAIEGGQYTLAKKLIAEGKKHHGTVRDWREKLLDIAYREKDKLTTRALTYDFAFAAGCFDEKYYRKWKATFSATEWPDELSTLIAARRAEAKAETSSMAKGWYYGLRESPSLRLLGPLYVEEKMWNELMALIQSGSSLRALLEYHGYLAPRFPDKMIDLYFPVFLDAGDKADKRGAYADLSKKMCHVITSIPQGKERIQQAAGQLIAKYPRRPAMIEELGKVLKM